jgi:D-amino-acid oxidase
MPSKPILVLGCGVSGLSTGITLLRAGHPVTILARDLPPNTTSNQAAAIWFPYLAKPREKVDPWAKYSLAFFRENLVPDPASGCALTLVHDLYDKPVETPWWAGAVDRYSRIDPERLPKSYVDGFEIESVVIDTLIYMDYLVAWFRKLGGEIFQREIKDIGEAMEFNSLVVNCTGLGSRTLFGDKSLYPVRGQTVKVRPNGSKVALLNDEGLNGLAYIIPRSKDIVLGGTAQENDWEFAPRVADRDEILRKAAALDPRFAHVEILSEGVGLRPARPTVRLEAERVGKGTVIHNYGHGGAGFTLSWGCAEEVLALTTR